jgi:di/tricarboxylate transporter
VEVFGLCVCVVGVDCSCGFALREVGWPSFFVVVVPVGVCCASGLREIGQKAVRPLK